MTPNDAINAALALTPEDALYALRTRRPSFVDGAEASRASVLNPEEDLGLSSELRYAVAHRAAAFGANAAFLAGYPAPGSPELHDLANGAMPDDPSLAALARHTDMIVSTPAKASNDHLQDLLSAGFTVPQIIALSELLAQVCYEMRIVHGLSLLKETADA